jgi:hypothetical protein
MELLGDVSLVEARFGAFGDSANFTKDMCTVCAERSRGSKIVLDAPNGTPRCRGSCGISFKFVLEIGLVSVQGNCMV